MAERSSGRRRRGQERPVRDTGGITQSPWRQISYRTPPMEIISADALERIHQAGLSILKETGMKVLSDDARALYAGAGFDVTQMPGPIVPETPIEPSPIEALPTSPDAVSNEPPSPESTNDP